MTRNPQLEPAASWNEERAAKCARALKREKNHDTRNELCRDINRHMRNAVFIRGGMRRD